MSETKNDERGASGEVLASSPAREAFRAAYPQLEKLAMACIPEGKQCLFFSAAPDGGSSAVIFARGEDAEQDLRAAWAVMVAIRDYRAQGLTVTDVLVEVTK